jgi:hypothetical protein
MGDELHSEQRIDEPLLEQMVSVLELPPDIFAKKRPEFHLNFFHCYRS